MNSKKISFFFLFLLSIFISSCRIETAKSPENKQLFILSDYLTQSDTILFRPFSRKENVSIQIIGMESEKIIGLIRNEGASIHADIIMVESISDIHKMSKSSLLQRINFSNELDEDKNKYSSWTYNFVGFGIDPFVVANSREKNIRIYDDLLSSRFINELDEKKTITMLSPVMHKLKKVKANMWIKKFIDSSYVKTALIDSLNANLPILTTYSDFSSNKDTLLDYENRFLVYPNSKSTGIFYNLRTIGIIDQAQNYTVARDFIFYCLEEKNNRQINNIMNTFSLSPNKKIFRIYNVSQDKLIEYNQTVVRLLNKIK